MGGWVGGWMAIGSGFWFPSKIVWSNISDSQNNVVESLIMNLLGTLTP
jgi:hypothetical protein